MTTLCQYQHCIFTLFGSQGDVLQMCAKLDFFTKSIKYTESSDWADVSRQSVKEGVFRTDDEDPAEKKFRNSVKVVDIPKTYHV